MQKIIVLAGEIACGKGTIVKYLEEKYGAKSVRFSTILRDIIARLYLEESRENLQKLSTCLRQTFSEDILSYAIAEDAKKIKNQVVLLDGARRESDIKYLKEISGFMLVYIEADPKVCYERMILRGENSGEKQKTFEEFLTEREQEAEIQIRSLKKMADFVLDNNGSQDDLKKQVDEMLKEINSVK